jgi:hypothetical protein
LWLLKGVLALRPGLGELRRAIASVGGVV